MLGRRRGIGALGDTVLKLVEGEQALIADARERRLDLGKHRPQEAECGVTGRPFERGLADALDNMRVNVDVDRGLFALSAADRGTLAIEDYEHERHAAIALPRPPDLTHAGAGGLLVGGAADDFQRTRPLPEDKEWIAERLLVHGDGTALVRRQERLGSIGIRHG